MLCGAGDTPCPYGKRNVVFANDMKKNVEYNTFANKLKPLAQFAVIGDYVYTALYHLLNYCNSIRERDFFFIEGMVHIEKFTPEFIVELLNYKPRNSFGEVLSDYQKNMIPEFIRGLRQQMPELYQQVQAIYPEISEKEIRSFVGKRAILKTLLPCQVRLSATGNSVSWDGKIIRTTGNTFGILYGLSDEEVMIVPTDSTLATVLENESVTPDTIFIN
jgi:hypothetical protein